MQLGIIIIETVNNVDSLWQDSSSGMKARLSRPQSISGSIHIPSRDVFGAKFCWYFSVVYIFRSSGVDTVVTLYHLFIMMRDK